MPAHLFPPPPLGKTVWFAPPNLYTTLVCLDKLRADDEILPCASMSALIMFFFTFYPPGFNIPFSFELQTFLYFASHLKLLFFFVFYKKKEILQSRNFPCPLPSLLFSIFSSFLCRRGNLFSDYMVQQTLCFPPLFFEVSVSPK